MLRTAPALIALLAALSWSTLAPRAAGADVVSLVADEWCPINCEPGAAKPGYAVEVARLVFEKAGHTLEYKTMNWARSLEEARRGKFSGVIGAIPADAPDFVYPAESVGTFANAFFVRAGSPWRYQGIPSLAGVALGVIRDYAYGDELDAYVERHRSDPKRVQVASGDDALDINLKKLAAGRLDVVVESAAVGRYAVHTLGLTDRVVFCCDDGEALPSYIAFSPANPRAKEYAELLSKGLVELRASGKLKEILAAYGLADWKKP
ncbi:MAG: substrate-binding periplasmic protein [Deferrisomatales bacterium]